MFEGNYTEQCCADSHKHEIANVVQSCDSRWLLLNKRKQRWSTYVTQWGKWGLDWNISGTQGESVFFYSRFMAVSETSCSLDWISIGCIPHEIDTFQPNTFSGSTLHLFIVAPCLSDSPEPRIGIKLCLKIGASLL